MGMVTYDGMTEPRFVGDKQYQFSIYPWHHPWRFMNRGQIYAYEKYLAKLGEQLALLRMKDITEVQAILHVRTTFLFQTP